MQKESDEPLPSPPVRFPGDGLPPIEMYPSYRSDESGVRMLSPEESQRVNERLQRALRLHQEQQSTEPEQSKLDKIANRKPGSSVKSTTVLNACFVLSLLLMIGSTSFLSQPFSLWAGRCGVILLAGCVSYSVSMDSDKAFPDLVKNAIITCLILGGLSFLTHGDEVRDDAGGIVSEGFQTSFDQKAGAGMRVFIGLFIGAFTGVVMADRRKQSERQNDV